MSKKAARREERCDLRIRFADAGARSAKQPQLFWNFRKRTNPITIGKDGRIANGLFYVGANAQNFKMRVRSWLRMNAGGVLNTCKSNGDMK